MSRPDLEQNLLFVVLALQNEFLTRDELVEVLNAWALEKAKPIADVMVERDFLRAEDRPVIDLLLKRQLKRHGSPQESILQSPTVNHLLKSIQSVADAELRDSLRAMLGEDSKPTDVTQSYARMNNPLSVTDFDVLQHGGFDRYKIVRPHAKGGLGEIFVARDEELDREVALKEIQPRYAKDKGSFLRFVVEARVTGGLEHPGVVPIYGFGQYPDGRPFYAMRFIRGESFKDAIDHFYGPKGPTDPGERRLGFRNLLGRLIDACNAVGYAHNRGVLHRDLKPANIMLGKFGETMVVDWGLAKVVGRDEIHRGGDESTLMPTSGSIVTETVQGSAMGTPAFMPPEQAEGRLDDMVPASDIYSLGATLYVILTGKPAFEGNSVENVLTLVKQNRFPQPREVDPSVPPALNAICRKAMALNPAERYPSALAFAADIEHWMADEPVSAYPEPLLARTGRWLRRHRTAAAAMAMVLATGAVAASVGMVLINKEKNNTELALKEVTKEKERTQAALAGESSARKQTRSALNTVTDDLIGETMARQAVLTDHDRDYLKRVLKQFEQFTAEKGNSEEARSIRAEGYLRVANLRRRLGELDASADSFSKAKELLTGLNAERPASVEYRQDLAATLNNEGLLLYDLGKYKEALADFEAALAPLQSLVKESADDHKSRWSLAILHGNIANAYLKLAKFTDSEKAFDLALETLSDAYLELSTSPFAQQDYARILTNFAALLAERGRREKDAERLDRQAIAELEKLVKATRGSPAFKQDLANAKSNLGKLLVSLGRHQEALVELRAAAAMQTELKQEFPALNVHRHHLAMTQSAIGKALAGVGDKGFEKEIAAAEAELKSLVAEQPKRPEFKQDLGGVVEAKGVIESNLLVDAKGVVAKEKDLEAALKYLQRAAELRDEVAAVEPGSHQYFLERMATQVNIANVVRLQEQFKIALMIYRKVEKETETRAELPSFYIRQLSFGIADCLMKLEDFAGALPYWERLTQDRSDPRWSDFELQRAIATVRVGKINEGLEAADSVLKGPKVQPVNFYDVGCCCALASAGVKSNPEESERLAKSAMGRLEDAARAGFFKENFYRLHIRKDTDLDSLRSRPDFKAFLAKPELTPAKTEKGR